MVHYNIKMVTLVTVSFHKVVIEPYKKWQS